MDLHVHEAGSQLSHLIQNAHIASGRHMGHTQDMRQVLETNNNVKVTAGNPHRRRISTHDMTGIGGKELSLIIPADGTQQENRCAETRQTIGHVSGWEKQTAIMESG